MEKYDNVYLYIDLHRNSSKQKGRSENTILIDNVPYAKLFFVVGTGIGTGAEFHFHPGDVIRDRTALGFVLLLDVRQLHPRGHGRRRNLAGLEGQLKLLGRL